MSVIRSISKNESEIINGILSLHNGGFPFDLDVCYSRGSFYKSGVVPQPVRRFDIDPQDFYTDKACVTNLPIKPASVDSIVFDPPFMFNPHGTARAKNAAGKRFTMFDTWADLERTYKLALNEFYRVLRYEGIVAFKCQDMTDSKTTLTHCYVWQWATARGFCGGWSSARTPRTRSASSRTCGASSPASSSPASTVAAARRSASST